MRLEACSECHRPYSRNELAKRRHEEIVRLRQQDFLLKEIARVLGIKNLSSVWWHLAGKCRCNGAKP